MDTACIDCAKRRISVLYYFRHSAGSPSDSSFSIWLLDVFSTTYVLVVTLASGGMLALFCLSSLSHTQTISETMNQLMTDTLSTLQVFRTAVNHFTSYLLRKPQFQTKPWAAHNFHLSHLVLTGCIFILLGKLSRASPFLLCIHPFTPCTFPFCLLVN